MALPDPSTRYLAPVLFFILVLKEARLGADLRESPWGADGQTAQAMLVKQASPKGGRGLTPNTRRSR